MRNKNLASPFRSLLNPAFCFFSCLLDRDQFTYPGLEKEDHARAESGIFHGRGSDDPDNKRTEHVYYQRVHGKDPRAVERDERHGVSRRRAYKPTRPDGKKIQHI